MILFWIFDKTNRPASHPRGVHHKTDYQEKITLSTPHGSRGTFAHKLCRVDRVNHPRASIKPLCLKKIKKNCRNFFSGFYCSPPKTLIDRHQMPYYSCGWTLMAVDIPPPVFALKCPYKANLTSNINCNINRLPCIPI